MKELEPLQQLIRCFSGLPGIGKKSARRLAFHLLAEPKQKSEDLAQIILQARHSITHCSICHSYALEEICDICSDSSRDSNCICVVEKASDILNFESSGIYRGTYHVLGGCLSPLDGIGPEKLHIPQLIQRIKSQKVEELILALGSSADAESTAHFIDRAIGDLAVKRSRLARGIPMGSDLDYVDELTVQRAFEFRTKL